MPKSSLPRFMPEFVGPVFRTIEVMRVNTLWMPMAVAEGAAVRHMDALCSRRFGLPDYEVLHTARMAVAFDYRDTVAAIAERGCLLHVNAPAFGGV